MPICTTDARIGVLCPKCEARLERGEITSVDVEVSFILVKAVRTIPQLDSITLVRAYEAEDELVLVLGSGDARKLLSDPDVIRKLRDFLGRRVWVTEEGDDRRFIEYLLHPLHVLTLNTVWLPDGSRTTRVLIAGRPSSKLPLDIEKAKKIINDIKGLELEIRFERPSRKKGIVPRQYRAGHGRKDRGGNWMGRGTTRSRGAGVPGSSG